MKHKLRIDYEEPTQVTVDIIHLREQSKPTAFIMFDDCSPVLFGILYFSVNSQKQFIWQ